ncbi:excinuclease ABC subunit UvrB [Mucispirillum schaedleri]|uniref:UvrABC system protein B n=1 Tax=Mucispirillum schaedleri ASF457 TaxID=1379858 RepID=V2QBT2_9BACT|nr:excinuclease ABC subunit UvrB [Mucispirillum schaedleri]MCX4360124.1 excinuclease ABC subunit UvrB [Mucispirillum schaedleri]USF24705.1 UvrABC system protein B [Mucispirillum schaedleri ASF457]SIW07862.1 excinulease of nucleotide excision repair, DNA damage recognition component [Mucispirillum schaedleri ASF457]
MEFKISSEYEPAGDQIEAIEQIVSSYKAGAKRQVLLGVTGSGKTFTMANVIERLQVPTLIIAHNKTLAAQLYGEFLKFFPDNAVEYFVSYYDYYQPEAYIPSSDTYIEKDSAINEEIEKLRNRATRSLIERRDVIIVASVSCIYGLGSPETYATMIQHFEAGNDYNFDDVLMKLVQVRYERNDIDFHRGVYRVKGDTIEIFPSHEDETAYRLEFFGDTLDRISEFNAITGKTLNELTELSVYPNTHYVTNTITVDSVIEQMKKDLLERCAEFVSQNKLLEEQRLTQRTMFDIEMIKETGYCTGIENYSRYFDGRAAGSTPYTLISYLPKDALVIIDESHITIPQVRGMYNGDRSRKMTLVDFGFRLPVALDNRPLKFDEFDSRVNNVLYVSATPDRYEIEQAQGVIAEQIIRPTGLMDPEIEVRPARTQVDDLYAEILKVTGEGGRVLVTTLTKRMAEELTRYYKDMGIKVEYLHSEIDTLQRIKIITSLRLGEFDVLVGINLLREGLDIPEVKLVAILDADKEGFLRSTKSLIQTIGRAARNAEGRAIFYGDKISGAMQQTIDETVRRRAKQQAYNDAHGITPETVKSAISDILSSIYEKDYFTVEVNDSFDVKLSGKTDKDIEMLEKKMYKASEDLDFETAAKLRDLIFELKAKK